MGTTPIGVAKRAKKYDIPVIAFAGTLGEDADNVMDAGIDAIFSIIQEPGSLENALENAADWLKETTRQVINII